MSGGKANNRNYLEKFIAGDKEAFAFFYNLHVDALYYYGKKLCFNDELVKDAIQEIFLDLFLKRQNNKTNPENLRWYLFLALKRILIKKLKYDRKMINEKKVKLNFEPEYSIEDLIIENEEEAELNMRVKEAIDKLSSGQKEALYLRYNESMEYTEVAKILQITVESARKQVYRAINSIRKELIK